MPTSALRLLSEVQQPWNCWKWFTRQCQLVRTLQSAGLRLLARPYVDLLLAIQTLLVIFSLCSIHFAKHKGIDPTELTSIRATAFCQHSMDRSKTRSAVGDKLVVSDLKCCASI